MNWFIDCATVAQIKTHYRTLAMQYHPDRGGDTRTMQDINAAYLAALKRQDGTTERGTDGRPHTYYYNQPVEQAMIDKIAQLLRLRLNGIDIWLIGTWLWVKGDTRPCREQLKAAGLWWHSKRTAWYWHTPEHHSHYNARVDLGTLAAAYGARHFDSAPSEETALA